jgi:kumamolisin
MAKRSIPGSERQPFKQAKAVGAADPTESFEVTVLLPRRSRDQFESRLHAHVASKDRTHLRREEFAQQFGADETDAAAVKSFANQHGLKVVEENLARRTIRLSGTVAQFEAAFGVTLQTFEYGEGKTYRGRTGPILVPDDLPDIKVLGLDNRPQAMPHFRLRSAGTAVAPRAAGASMTPPQVASLYGFPTGNANGQCIAIIELGGGFEQADIQEYFSGLNVAVPSVTAVSVDGGSNAPTGDPNGPDGEVMLDIEVAGSVAPGAALAVYFTPNTDAGFLDAITTAVHDTTNKPSVISISWGSAEVNWTAQAMQAMDSAFQDATMLGVTVTVASGDNGSSDGVSDGQNHVDFPASSSYALGCGGTNLSGANGAISSEVTWNELANNEGASGGGVSTVFPLPSWQQNLQVTDGQGNQSALQARGVPDVSGDADPQTGYTVRIDGTDTVIGGTSAVAPLWAGLVALINAKCGPVGFINPKLYSNPTSCRDVTSGNNPNFSAVAGWDACTGLGSPNGQNAINVFCGN